MRIAVDFFALHLLREHSLPQTATSLKVNHPMKYSFEFPAGMDRAEVIHAHRLRDTCMHCGFEAPPEECLESRLDYLKSTRRTDLLEAIDLRRGDGSIGGRGLASSGYIAEVAAHRYFMLLVTAQAALKGRFTLPEFSVILNAECTPIWDWDTYTSVAAMVADDNGIDCLEDVPNGGLMHELLTKLSALTQLENAALVDACERVWRGYENPLL